MANTNRKRAEDLVPGDYILHESKDDGNMVCEVMAKPVYSAAFGFFVHIQLRNTANNQQKKATYYIGKTITLAPPDDDLPPVHAIVSQK